nr:hypothetical protein [Altererythrobacter sp. CC-YST694]
MAGDAGKAHEQPVGHKSEIRTAAQVELIARADRGFQEAAFAGGLLGVEFNCAADGILACQRPLRAAQDFHPIKVQQIDLRAEDSAVINIVHVKTDAGFIGEVGVCLADAANEHGRAGAECRSGGLQHHVRCTVGEIGYSTVAAGSQAFTVNRRDRDRRILQPLFTELRRDDDFPHVAIRRCRTGRILRHGRGHASEGSGCRA